MDFARTRDHLFAASLLTLDSSLTAFEADGLDTLDMDLDMEIPLPLRKLLPDADTDRRTPGA